MIWTRNKIATLSVLAPAAAVLGGFLLWGSSGSQDISFNDRALVVAESTKAKDAVAPPASMTTPSPGEKAAPAMGMEAPEKLDTQTIDPKHHTPSSGDVSRETGSPEGASEGGPARR